MVVRVVGSVVGGCEGRGERWWWLRGSGEGRVERCWWW